MKAIPSSSIRSDSTARPGSTRRSTCSSDALHVVERIRFIDADHLEYEITFDDPKIYAKPFKNTRVFVRMRPGDELMEWWCMENNKDLLEGRLSDTHINP